MHQLFTGIVLMVISGICYGFAPILAVYAYEGGASVIEYVFLRYATASLLYLFYLLLRRHRFVLMPGRKAAVALIAAGVLQAAAAYLYMFTVKELSAGFAAILFYSYIVWVAIWGFLFNRERLSPAAIAGISLAFLGLVFAVGVSRGQVSTGGIIAGLISALACSGFVMGSNSALKTTQPVPAAAYAALFTALPLLLLGCTAGSLDFQMSAGSWAASIASGVLTCNVALLAFMGGMKRLGSTAASVLCTVEPITVVVLSFLLLGQKMTFLQLLGGILIIVGAGFVVTGTTAVSSRRPGCRAG